MTRRKSLHTYHLSALFVPLILLSPIIATCQSSAFIIPSSFPFWSAPLRQQQNYQHRRNYYAGALFASKKNKNKKVQKSSPRPTKNSGGGFGSSPQKSSKKPSAEKEEAPPPKSAVYKHEAPPELQTRIPIPTPQQQLETEEEEPPLPGTTSAAKKRQQKRQKWSQQPSSAEQEQAEEEASSSSLSAEELLLQTLFTREFHKQELLNTLPSVPKKLIQISTHPLVFIMDEFIDPDLCRRVTSDGAGCFDLLYPETLSDNLFGGQESKMDGLLFNSVTSQDHNQSQYYPDGIHMDTNGQCLFRHVTAILYLNDVPQECGGATVFPIARALPNDPALAASKRLFQEHIPHTRTRMRGLETDAQWLESRTGETQFTDDMTTNTAIKIQPKAGRLLVFFSRDASGHQDPRAWHAGERLLPGKDGDGQVVTEKRILTLFKEVDYCDSCSKEDHYQVQTTFEGFLAPLVSQQRELLQERAASY